jgi:hypothetical protein
LLHATEDASPNQLSPVLFPYQVHLSLREAFPQEGMVGVVQEVAGQSFGLGPAELAPAAASDCEYTLRFTESTQVWNKVAIDGVLGLERAMREGYNQLVQGLQAMRKSGQVPPMRVCLVQSWSSLVMTQHET